MESIKMWALGIGAGITIGAICALAKKKLPDMLAGYVDKIIDKMLFAGDDIDDELVLALCRWAEKKVARQFPGGYMGAKKYQMVADKLISVLPITVRPFVSPRSAKIAEVIEANVLRLKKELAEHTDSDSLHKA